MAAGVLRDTLRSNRRLPGMRPLTAFLIVAAVIVLLLVPYLQPLWAQRSALAASQTEIADLNRQVADLQTQLDRWNDPAYVKAVARQRLHYVMPGEVGYVLLPDPKAQQPADPRTAAATTPQQAAGHPWYDTVWQSLQAAGEVKAHADPAR